ncbi:dual specificity catalytic domain containing protein [Stylonychia lemnae]|uniref:Dual specificity catalytic domain containing protein n=1 Tax=Stylonychia lemnae TaxID=5949 RepID=A0A078AH11_STYLE|nr:dual specificity catalytic domain containing protein [Stylonychia lemnae]|eukprot:CDW80148.1 dual specificity catalytic domain containing protein [Stylonychia lemnae]
MAQQQQLMSSQSPMDDDMIGAIKIKDALFIGDEFAAQDLEFVVANKVTHIVNCAGKQVPNHWEPIGVAYMTFYWLDQENQILFDPSDETTNKIYDFIDGALGNAESVLVHSVRGQSRSSCVIAAYLMRKYKWSLLKTLEFLNSRRPDLEIRATFIHQLSAYEARLHKTGNGPKTQKWTEISEENCFLESEELLLRNTFLNAQMGPIAQFNPALLNDQMNPNQKLKWIDEHTNGQELLGQEGDPEMDLCLKTHIEEITIHRRIHPKSVKTAIKVPVCQNQVMKNFPSMYYTAEQHQQLQQQQQQQNKANHNQQNSQEKPKQNSNQNSLQNSGHIVLNQNQVKMNPLSNVQQSNQQPQQFQDLKQGSFDKRQIKVVQPGQISNQQQQQQQPTSQPQLQQIRQPQMFYPKVDDSVHSEDLSELNNEVIQQNNRQSVQKKSINTIGNVVVPQMNPATNISQLDNKYPVLNQHNQQQQQQQQNSIPQQQQQQVQNQQQNQSQGRVQNYQPISNQINAPQVNPMINSDTMKNQNPQFSGNQQMPVNNELMRKNLDEQRRIHQIATQMGAQQQVIQTTSQMQQVQPNVTNIINNNNINNFFIQNPPIDILNNNADRKQQPQLQNQGIPQKIQIQNRSDNPQKIQIVHQSQVQQTFNPQQVSLNQRLQQSTATASKQRSGSARPIQNINGDAEPLASNNNQIINTDNSESNVMNPQKLQNINEISKNGSANAKPQQIVKKKRGESPQIQTMVNKYGGTNAASGTSNMYQQLQNQIKTSQNRIITTQGQQQPLIQSAQPKINGFGSARAGATQLNNQSKGTTNGSQGIKLNSFRGGPVKATQNAIDSKGPIQLNKSGGQPISSQIQGQPQHQQRPNSSKPVLKNSFNNDNSNNMTANINESNIALGQVIQESQQKRPQSTGNRPSSPGTGKIIKTNNQDSSQRSQSKGKPRLRSASPGQNNNSVGQNSNPTQQPSNLGQPVNVINKNGQSLKTAMAKSGLGQRIAQVTGVGPVTGSTKHVPQLYMRGYSPSKPKWKK